LKKKQTYLINDLIGFVGWTKKDESPKHCWKNISSIKVYRNCNYTSNNGETLSSAAQQGEVGQKVGAITRSDHFLWKTETERERNLWRIHGQTDDKSRLKLKGKYIKDTHTQHTPNTKDLKSSALYIEHQDISRR
jgi:hypothetical protein